MKQFVLVMMLVLGMSYSVSAQETAGQANDAAVATDQQPVNAGNKLCPVSGEKIGEMGEAVPFEYKGKIYNMCCAMCAKDFKKDPEKYSKIADEEVAAALKTGS